MKFYGTRNRRRWAIGAAFDWEAHLGRMVILQFGPYVAWLQWPPKWGAK